jgi:hypothetical protein
MMGEKRYNVDTAFWQAIKQNDFAIPPGYSVESLTEYLLSAPGNTNPEIREGPNHEVLENWIMHMNVIILMLFVLL